MNNIVIVGKGGFAREVKWLIKNINDSEKKWNFLGFIDNQTEAEEVVGDDTYIANMKEKLYVAIAIGNPEIRSRLHKIFRTNRYIRFPNLIAPSAQISEDICLGEGNIICAGNIMTVDISLGSLNIINLGCTIGHDVRIGNYNTINPGTNISGNVIIKNFVEIGTGTKIIQGRTVNSGAITGAGAVIIADIPCGTTVVGVPAKEIRYHRQGVNNG